MLFKVLADHIGLPCALVRGEYNRSWVELAIPDSKQEEKPSPPSPVPSEPSPFITSPLGHLLHHIGTQWLPQPEPESKPETEPETCYKMTFTPNYMIKPNRIVDLMNDIGSLYPLNTYKAIQYCNKPQVYSSNI